MSWERRFRRISSDVLLALFGVGLALLLAEVGLRAYYVLETSRALARMSAAGPETIDTGIGVMDPGVRTSAVPGVLYELRPNLRGIYDGRRFATNHFGFRMDHEIDVDAPSGTRRVVGIGDSWMWGSGVDNGQTYLDVLQGELTKRGERVEVINTAVWGYDPIQEVATLRFKALGLRPDVVVVGLCANDRSYPDFLARGSFVSLGRSFLWYELASRVPVVFGRAPVSRPNLSRRMPYVDFIGAYAELAHLSKSNGFETVIFSDCIEKDGTQSPDCDLGTEDEFRDFVARLDQWGFHRCPYELTRVEQNYPSWGHASVAGNQYLASVLRECVQPLLAARR